MNTVGGVEDLLDDLTLRVVEEGLRAGMFPSQFRTHDRLNGISAIQNIADVGTFGGDGIGCSEAATGAVLRSTNEAEISCLPALIELGPDVAVRCLTHATTQRVPQNHPLVGDSFPLEDFVASKRDRFLGGARPFRLLFNGTDSRSGDYLLRLIAEVGRHVPMGCKNLSCC